VGRWTRVRGLFPAGPQPCTRTVCPSGRHPARPARRRPGRPAL